MLANMINLPEVGFEGHGMILRSILIVGVGLGFATAALAGEAGSNPQQSQQTAGKATQPKRKHVVKRAPEQSAPEQDCCEPYRYVYAESWYGSGKTVAPVRHGPLGDEVLLPGGIWVTCEFSCEYILRKQTLDYFEHQGAGSGSQASPTYPRHDFYVDGWGYRHDYMF